MIIDSTGIQDAFGEDLDGEWTTGSTDPASGDGIAGGDFVFEMITLPGDVDGVVKSAGQVVVDADDFVAIAGLQNEFVLDLGGTNVASAGFDPRGDLDGSGIIGASDTIDVIDEQNAIVLPTSSKRASGGDDGGKSKSPGSFGLLSVGGGDGFGASVGDNDSEENNGKGKESNELSFAGEDDLDLILAEDSLLDAIDNDRESDDEKGKTSVNESLDSFFGNEF